MLAPPRGSAPPPTENPESAPDYMVTQLTGGGPRISLSWRHQHTILPNFPKHCMELKEFGRGGRPKFYYVDPPLLTYKALHIKRRTSSGLFSFFSGRGQKRGYKF